MITCPNTTTTTVPMTDSTADNMTEITSAALHLPEWAIALICVLGMTVLVLTVMIVAVFYRLCHLSRYDNIGILRIYVFMILILTKLTTG